MMCYKISFFCKIRPVYINLSNLSGSAPGEVAVQLRNCHGCSGRGRRIYGTDFVEALSEIGGENQFSCNSCDKVCKSKGGLTRQVNSKHCDKGYKASNLDIPALTKVTKDGLCSIVNKIKLNVRNEGYWDQQITSDLKNDSLTLYNLYTNDLYQTKPRQIPHRILRAYSHIIWNFEL